MKTKPTTYPALGSLAFDSLKAEAELDWLGRVMIEPPELARMMQPHSVLIIGARGSGKTALRLALLQKSLTLPLPRPLAVEWRPELPKDLSSESGIVRTYMDQVLSSCALALLRFVATTPAHFNAAPIWARETLSGLIQQYLPGHPELRLDELEGEVSVEGLSVARQMLESAPRSTLNKDAGQNIVISTLANCIKKMNLSGIWIVVDQLELWLDLEAQAMAQSLYALIKSLSLFEISGFEFKLIAPREFETELKQLSAMTIRRIDGYPLEWSETQLAAILERRLAAAFGKNEFPLEKFAPREPLLAFLKEYGADLPKAWLELLKPFVEDFRKHSRARPFSQKEFVALQRKYPPLLRRDFRTKEYALHYKPLVLTGQPRKLLAYLYEKRSCTRHELYFLGLRGLPQIPESKGDKDWEEPDGWHGTFDTTLYRLRAQVEPIPEEPRYIITNKNTGKIVLQNAM